MVQVPTEIKVKVPPLVIVHTPVVDEVNEGVKLESDVALKVGVVPKFLAPGLLNVMVCVVFGVTVFEEAEAGPVPAALSAVTVKVYA